MWFVYEFSPSRPGPASSPSPSMWPCMWRHCRCLPCHGLHCHGRHCLCLQGCGGDRCRLSERMGIGRVELSSPHADIVANDNGACWAPTTSPRPPVSSTQSVSLVAASSFEDLLPTLLVHVALLASPPPGGSLVHRRFRAVTVVAICSRNRSRSSNPELQDARVRGPRSEADGPNVTKAS